MSAMLSNCQLVRWVGAFRLGLSDFYILMGDLPEILFGLAVSCRKKRMTDIFIDLHLLCGFGLFLLNQPQGRFSLVVSMSMCVSVYTIVRYSQLSFYIHKFFEHLIIPIHKGQKSN